MTQLTKRVAVGVALVALGSVAFFLGRQAVKTTPTPTADKAWIAQATSQLDRAGVKATMDGTTYSNNTIAKAMYVGALQQAVGPAMAAASPKEAPVPPVDLGPFVKPPNIADARQAVVAVAIDDLVMKDVTIGGHRPTAPIAAKDAIFDAAGVPPIRSVATNTQPPLLSSDPATATAQQHALAGWVATALKHHRFTTVGLGGLMADDIPALIVA